MTAVTVNLLAASISKEVLLSKEVLAEEVPDQLPEEERVEGSVSSLRGLWKHELAV